MCCECGCGLVGLMRRVGWVGVDIRVGWLGWGEFVAESLSLSADKRTRWSDPIILPVSKTGSRDGTCWGGGRAARVAALQG
ncbi:Uncharacterised protein [Dermatophilus congolensis]|uniref:Uncharacterized protein n=1 Tax=Dermatophilus congolensis TaxID=1863 RepID=A0A239V8Y0_9MICO|nr:Uncharacterised protein [Dermatophilus congolensis]